MNTMNAAHSWSRFGSTWTYKGYTIFKYTDGFYEVHHDGFLCGIDLRSLDEAKEYAYAHERGEFDV